MTQLERIKAMSVEELAAFISCVIECNDACNCSRCPMTETINCEISGITDWLESEVECDA